MPVGPLISVEEYLATVYRPDCDYVDGHVEERNLGERDHSNLQMVVSAYLFARRKRWGIQVYPAQRVQVKPARFRVRPRQAAACLPPGCLTLTQLPCGAASGSVELTT